MAYFGKLSIQDGSLKDIFEFVHNNQASTSKHFHFLAASSVNLAFENDELLRIFNSGISLADSRPLTLSMRLMGESTKNIRGADFLRYAISNDVGITRHFFIGSSSETVHALIATAMRHNPKFTVAGIIIPDFQDAFENEYSDWNTEISECEASIIWIGISTPKQDIIAEGLSKISKLPTIAVGAAFDFVGGNLPEAPRTLRLLSMEWLFRLSTEPKRLWKRYLIGNFKFIVHATKIVVAVRFKQSRIFKHIRRKS